MTPFEAVIGKTRVLPVLVIDRVEAAVPTAEALVGCGLPVLEVALRTPAALEAIRAMQRVEGAIVGAGTVVSPADLAAARAAGARFIVSPGLTGPLGQAARDLGVPFLPGVATASDVMRGLDLGFDRFKFFPATAGLSALAAVAAAFPAVRFCPTGGITGETAARWLAHPAVFAVGGSWMVKGGRVNPAAARGAARL
ncbi:bifunctional 4-hydroxy-2-oxoglutarate aldolase/2-dehydro-3-deoxy-phosphogluconate aldolase [Thermaurantiacus sp.]